MAYIVPGGTIRICKNVPLNNTYRDTILFDSTTEQFSYFVGKAKYSLDDYTYMRVNHAIRVEIKADDLYDCNYLVFRNNTFGTKYFYAFITKVTYINNETSEIEYELDVLQTWHFDYQLKQCFVEREHSATDEPGDNLVEENLETGEYTYSSKLFLNGISGDMTLIFANTFHTESVELVPNKNAAITTVTIGKMTSGLEYVVIKPTDLSLYLSQINTAGLTEGVVSIFVVPSMFVNLANDGVHLGTNIVSVTQTLDKETNGSIDGYTPKCKKLYTNPYNALMVSTGDGVAAIYPYEYFSTDDVEFQCIMPVQNNPQILLRPLHYKGLRTNNDEKLVLTDFPQIPYTSDTYKIWLAQNASSQSLQNLSGALSVVGGVVSIVATKGGAAAKAIPAITGGISTITNNIMQSHQRSLLPDQAHVASGSTSMFTIGAKEFYAYRRTIRKEYAEIIDNYFNAYGYACHKVKIPNRSSRPRWNYVKTVNCNAIGSVPVQDMRKICEIYDNGITWWKQGENIGNYELDNSPG